MNRILVFFMVLGIAVKIQPTWAQGFGPEENSMISNGQGVSSPCFWDGLSGENPAGLVLNRSLKFQGGLASFDDHFSELRGSGGVLVGNGLLGAGLEYSQFSEGPAPDGDGQINWGIAGRIGPWSLGVSGHHYTEGGDGTFDIGALGFVTSNLRWGFQVPDFTHGLHIVAAGLSYSVVPSLDFVVDAAYHLQNENGTIKPGISIHSRMLQLTAAYGFHLTGQGDVWLKRKFTGGLGLELSRNVLLSYEYRGLPEHRLGLTLRLN